MFKITTKWHKVSENLPEYGCYVVILCSGKYVDDYLRIAYYYPYNRTFREGDRICPRENIKHWTYADEILAAIEKSAEADEAATTDSENQLSTV